MKKSLLLLIVLFSILRLPAQNQDIPASPKQKKFHLGAFYSFSRTWDNVHALSMHSVWYNQDLGTMTFNDDELDSINDLRTEQMDLQMLVVDVGMVFLNRTRWYIGGDIFFGISKVRFETEIDLPDNNEKKVISDFEDPIAGLSMNIRYNFSKKWGISLMPYFNYSWGTADVIQDSIMPNVKFFINNLEEKYTIGYGRLNLMASYQVKGILISLGPGFYYSTLQRTYSVDRTDPETNQNYFDEIESTLHTESFIDACLRIDWTIIDPLTLSVEFAAGKDLYTKAGLFFNF